MMMSSVYFCLLIVIASVWGDDHVSPCFADEGQCLQELRRLVNDPTAAQQFAFGGLFLVYSPNVTILTRLLPGYSSSDIQSIANNINRADVTFSGEARAHFSCGHQFESYPREQDGLRVDPIETTPWPLARVQSAPSVSWPGVPTLLPGGIKYTVVVMDAGPMFLHGLYVNSDLDLVNAQAVYPYGGPKNPFPSPHPYVWMVIPQQNGDIDAATLRASLFSLYNQDRTFRIEQFINTYFTLSDLTQMSMTIMNIGGDPYGAQYIKEMGFGNNCPLHVSMNKYLYRATTWAGLPLSWSRSLSSSPYLTSLTVEMDVTYSVEDISFESCCTQETFIRSQLTPDPFKMPFNNPERPVQVRDAPRVSLSPLDGDRFTMMASTYTLMLVDFGSDFQDFTAPLPSEPKFIIHWMRSNISRGDVTTGNDVIPYFGSNPFSPNSPRMYTMLLMKQSTTFNPRTLRDYVVGECVTDSFPQRCFYRLNDLLTDWGLSGDNMAAVTWFFAEQDAFARQRIYRTWAVRDKHTVCDGVPGYTWINYFYYWFFGGKH